MDTDRGAEDGENPPSLTKQQAIELQDLFIAAYREESFQQALREAWQDAAGDPQRQHQVRWDLCQEVQGQFLVRFGFPNSKRGTEQAISAFTPWNSDPEVR